MLEARALSFTYNAGQTDAITALDRVSIRIAPGELVAIIGHNGSGKSTLARLLCAVFDPTAGEVIVDGLAYQPETIWEVRRRVGMVFQRPDDQIVANTVIDDVAFGPENLGLPRDEIEQRVTDALELLGLAALGQTPVSELSAGEKQRLAIAGVLAMQPAYLILDEPTTMLAPRLARQLIDLLYDLRARLGTAIVHITHFIHEVVGFDRVIVLDGGRVLLDGSPREVFAHAATLESVGLAVPPVTALAHRLQARGIAIPGVVLTADELTTAIAASVPPTASAPTLPPPPPPPAPAAPLLETRDLRFTYLDGTPLARPALRGLSCRLSPGETLAVLGSAQAGKSTLIDFLNGLRCAPAGSVFFEGRDVAAPGFTLTQLREAVGVVFQQPEAQLFEETVGKDVSYVPRRKKLAPAIARALVARALTDVGLDYETFRLRYIHALSGGQKRRVALAGVLAAQPRVLILDEPVAGLDPRGRGELVALIHDLTRRLGLTVVLVGNALDDLIALADRVLVLHEGRVALEGTPRALLGQAERLTALGLELGAPAAIALALRAVCPDLPTTILDLDELEAALLQRLSPGLPAHEPEPDQLALAEERAYEL
ncbi:MAG: ATP-binding cassette domain-containing protein [Chloroflexales bacterium]|nr:ATP-binding cassette domain-containing protein [Chloroflexales bacterium]